MLAGSPPSTIAAGMRVCCSWRARCSWSAPPLWRCQCTIRVRSSTTCRRYMPTLRTPVCGLRVITCGRVMKRPPSLGQHFRIGRKSSEGFSVSITSWTGPRRTLRGLQPHARQRAQQVAPAADQPAQALWAGAGRSALPSRWLSSSRSSTPSAQAMRCAEPKALISTGMS